MAGDVSGTEFALRLLAAFRDLADDVHAELARRGHPHARPVHGFTLQAVGPRGSSAVEVAARLGVTKQAAGKTIDRLESEGYVRRSADPADARRKLVTVTARGHDLLQQSAELFDRALARRTERIGHDRMAELERGLRDLTSSAPPLDIGAWLGG